MKRIYNILGVLYSQSLYGELEKFDEGARFLEDFGRADEAGEFLAAIKG